MIDMIRINELFDQIENSKNILISGHISPDGDSIGSSFGLALILQEMGKNAKVIKNDEYPEDLKFLYRDDLYYNDEFDEIDLFIAVDSADISRLGISYEYLLMAKDSATIDHHITNEGYTNNDIIYMSSSACEIVADIFISRGVRVPREAANYLYLGILTDTYRFQYESATSDTLVTAARLIDLGANKKAIQEKLFENLDPNLLRLQVEVIDNAIRIGNKIIISKITYDLLEKYNVIYEKAETIVSLLRTIEGIEVSALIKEDAEYSQKVSFRSKSYINVAEIASEFGGGGHVRAAGASIEGTVDEVFDKVKRRLEKLYEDGDLVD